MDNSGAKKEEVSRTYQGLDGCTPIAAYLGGEAVARSLSLMRNTPGRPKWAP